MNKGVDQHKKSLRKQFLASRKAMNSNDLYSKSRFISSRLINTSVFIEAEAIHCYVSINRQNEVLTRNLIQFMIDQGKSVIVPKMEKEGQMSHYQIEDLESLVENSWGVAEPTRGNQLFTNTDDLDMIIIPMVAGDKFKNRLGYGKGFYDRFLVNVDSTKIGLLFDLQLYDKRLPTNTFDVKLDMLITESKIID